MIPNRFVYLDFLRFAFALIIFFGHARSFLVLEKAELAVDYFFILSGFVLTHAYHDRLSTPGFFSRFARDRIARLYPLHLVTLIILMFMNIWFLETTNGQWLEHGWSYQDGRIYTLSLNLVLLNNVGLTPEGPSWNAPAWSISVELWANLLLVILAITLRRFFVYICIIIFLFCYLILFVNIGSLGDFYRNTGIFNTGILRGLAGMAAGILSYAAYKKLIPIVQSRRSIITATALALVAMQFWLMAGGAHFSKSDFLIVPASGITVIAVALAESLRKRSKIDAALEWLGECSYSIYMIHWPVLVFINYFLIYAWGIGVDINHPVHFICITILVIVASRLSFNFIEKPGKKLIKSMKR